MLHIAIIASGKEYQEASAWAAATYVRQLKQTAAVSVLVPAREASVELLKSHSRDFDFAIRRFPFRTISERKFTSQLKCQGFYAAVSNLPEGDLLFIVDADTCCLKPLRVPPEIEAAIMAGKIGLAPDIADHHSRTVTDPWYLTPEERLTYVNSGVILTAGSVASLFKFFWELSETPEFLDGPFNDQKVINFALGKHFRDRLALLPAAYNGIIRSRETIIGHCAQGAGYLPSQPDRKLAHQKMCEAVLGGA